MHFNLIDLYAVFVFRKLVNEVECMVHANIETLFRRFLRHYSLPTIRWNWTIFLAMLCMAFSKHRSSEEVAAFMSLHNIYRAIGMVHQSLPICTLCTIIFCETSMIMLIIKAEIRRMGKANTMMTKFTFSTDSCSILFVFFYICRSEFRRYSRKKIDKDRLWLVVFCCFLCGHNDFITTIILSVLNEIDFVCIHMDFLGQ